MCGIYSVLLQEPQLLGDIGYKIAQILGRRGHDSVGFFYLGKDGRLYFFRDLVFENKGEDAARAAERLGIRNIPETKAFGVHTRWATSGKVDRVSQHPLYGCNCNADDPPFLILHNGILAGYQPIHRILKERGHDFSGCLSDTGVLACLIEDYLFANGGDLYGALIQSLYDFKRYGGENPSTSAIVVIGKDPLQMIGVSLNEKPLLFAKDTYENRYFTSEQIALSADITGGKADILVLKDGDTIQVTESDTNFANLNDKLYQVQIEVADLGCRVKSVDIKEPDIELGGFPHYFKKEIYQQPEATELTIAHLDATRSEWSPELDRMEQEFPNDIFLGAGTSNRTARYGQLYSRMRGRNARAEIASEVLCSPSIPLRTIVYSITQSGETEDLRVALSALRKRDDLWFITLCNTPGTTLTTGDYCDLSIITQAGYERGVMASKTYTALATALGVLNFRNDPKRLGMFRTLPGILARLIPYYDEMARHIIDNNGPIKKIGFSSKGSGILASEESHIKFGEGCQLWPMSVSANEWKHAFITGVGSDSYIVFYVPNDPWARQRTSLGIDQLITRGGNIIVVGSNLNGIGESDRIKYRVEIPEVSDIILPIVDVPFAQLLAYYNALALGLNPDNPENLAKAATTE